MRYNKTINRTEILEFNKFYHICNKAVGNELLFKNENDYFFFLKKLERFLLPAVEIYVYCLLPNHFHLLIRTKSEQEIIQSQKRIKKTIINDIFHLAFKNLFISYSKSFNKTHKRYGRLFVQPYKRILVEDEEYIITLINYIHRNPIHHGYVTHYSKWKYSSYNSCLSDKPTKINREAVLSFFTSKQDFIKFHEDNKTKPGIDKYYLE